MKTHKTSIVFGLVLTASFSSYAQYDPVKDPAYIGYKYKPGQGFTMKAKRLPPRPSCVREVKGTINVNGTFDGQGCLYTFKGTWKGKSYKSLCFAPKEIAEGMPPMFRLNSGATLKNLQIECALDGVHTSRNNTIENVVFRDVEEDAITAVDNITIKNTEFWFCNDKCIQMNDASNVDIVNSRFYYAKSAVMAAFGYNIDVFDNIFYETRTAIRSSGRRGKALVRAGRNRHENGVCTLGPESNGIIEDHGKNQTKNVKSYTCATKGGRVVPK